MKEMKDSTEKINNMSILIENLQQNIWQRRIGQLKRKRRKPEAMIQII
jgi:hypothetical protein